MIRCRRLVFMFCVAAVSLASMGCTDYVGSAARSSLATFLTQIFSTAVNASLTGT